MTAAKKFEAKRKGKGCSATHTRLPCRCAHVRSSIRGSRILAKSLYVPCSLQTHLFLTYKFGYLLNCSGNVTSLCFPTCFDACPPRRSIGCPVLDC